MIRRLGPALSCLLLLAAGPAHAQDSRLAPYLAARDQGAVGAVQGQSQAEPLKLGAAPRPLAGVSLDLLPWSDEIAEKLDAVKARARDSIKRFIGVGDELARLRADYDAELARAGGAGLARRGVTDASGDVLFADVPEGRWLLLGRRVEAQTPPKPAKTIRRESGLYTEGPKEVGHSSVWMWRMDVTVRAGESTRVRLTDRNLWLSLVEPTRTPPPDLPPGTGQRRR